MYKKKLIEVALPLDAINLGCQQEKNPFLKGHPRSMHLWWARRPLASARAVIFAQLVDDPSSHPEKFPTIDDQNRERTRLFNLLEDLCKWENINNHDLLLKANEEIRKYWDEECQQNADTENAAILYDSEKFPAIHDPFAGGGTIPLEGQRLGIESFASDLNPVAVLINEALIEIPHKYENTSPKNPEAKLKISTEWTDGQGFVEDIRYYGKLLKEEAIKVVGSNYPKIKYGGSSYNPIAWIWTRTVKCPNPACGCEMPLASTFILSTKKGKEAYIEPIIDTQSKSISYCVHEGKPKNNITAKQGRGAKFHCICCGEATTTDYIKEEAQHGRLGSRLMAVVIDTGKGKKYLTPDEIQIEAANVEKPDDSPQEKLPYDPRNIWCVGYGLDTYDKLYNNRQLTTLTTFINLLPKVINRMKIDGLEEPYAQDIGLYLSLGISQLTRYSSTLCGWNKTNENVAQVFGRQAIPMVWDYAESNPLFGSLDLTSTIEWPASSIHTFGLPGHAFQADAQTQKISEGKIISTDPPYFDNISYADLSDYFYVWLRKCLKKYDPKLFQTVLVPKNEELIASPYRHEGREEAERFFLEGMTKVFKNIAIQAHPSFPITIFYAFKQADKIDASGTSSTGWETFLTGIINSGLMITGTWPIRTERTKGLKGSVNTLASSIVLVCRKKIDDNLQISRRNFVKELKKELKSSLNYLLQSNIAPVDLAQSAIGPGMGVFSKYKKVLESNGDPMSVRSALQIINQELDIFFNEQDTDLRAEDRFSVDIYTQYGFDSFPFGDADTLARAKNTSVEKMRLAGTIFAEKGIVHLVDRDKLPTDINNGSPLWMLTQQLVYAMDRGGVDAAAHFLKDCHGRHDSMKSLAYRLYTIAEKKNWAQDAYVYNNLVVSWPEIQDRLAELNSTSYEEQKLF